MPLDSAQRRQTDTVTDHHSQPSRKPPIRAANCGSGGSTLNHSCNTNIGRIISASAGRFTPVTPMPTVSHGRVPGVASAASLISGDSADNRVTSAGGSLSSRRRSCRRCTASRSDSSADVMTYSASSVSLKSHCMPAATDLATSASDRSRAAMPRPNLRRLIGRRRNAADQARTSTSPFAPARDAGATVNNRPTRRSPAGKPGPIQPKGSAEVIAFLRTACRRKTPRRRAPRRTR